MEYVVGLLGKGQLLELGYGGCMAQLEEEVAHLIIGESIDDFLIFDIDAAAVIGKLFLNEFHEVLKTEVGLL